MNHQIDESSNHRITKSTNHRIIKSTHHRIIKSTNHHITKSTHQRTNKAVLSGPSNCWPAIYGVDLMTTPRRSLDHSLWEFEPEERLGVRHLQQTRLLHLVQLRYTKNETTTVPPHETEQTCLKRYRNIREVNT